MIVEIIIHRDAPGSLVARETFHDARGVSRGLGWVCIDAQNFASQREEFNALKLEQPTSEVRDGRTNVVYTNVMIRNTLFSLYTLYICKSYKKKKNTNCFIVKILKRLLIYKNMNILQNVIETCIDRYVCVHACASKTSNNSSSRSIHSHLVKF